MSRRRDSRREGCALLAGERLLNADQHGNKSAGREICPCSKAAKAWRRICKLCPATVIHAVAAGDVCVRSRSNDSHNSLQSAARLSCSMNSSAATVSASKVSRGCVAAASASAGKEDCKEVCISDRLRSISAISANSAEVGSVVEARSEFIVNS